MNRLVGILRRYSPENILNYIVGTTLYHMYYRGFEWAIPGHIVEQYVYRVAKMNRACYEGGSCVKCGCRTTELQFAFKPCEGDCYPPMMSKSKWARYKLGESVLIGDKAYNKRDYDKREA